MGYLSDYYAMKDAEDSQGNVDWNKVPLRNGGNLDTGHSEDIEFKKDDGGPRFDLRRPKE